MVWSFNYFEMVLILKIQLRTRNRYVSNGGIRIIIKKNWFINLKVYKVMFMAEISKI